MGRTSDANERLMNAALDLIWGESYGGVTIDDICKRADVKKGSFYYFFSSKSDLAVKALEHMWSSESKPLLDGMFSSSVEPLSRITTYLRHIHTRQAEIKAKYGRVLGCPVVALGTETCTCEEEKAVGDKIREMFARKRRYYESAIRDALAEGSIEPCDPAAKAVALAGLIEGLIVQARILDDTEILRNLPDLALRVIGAKTTSQAAATSA
ncbi:MAG TPA: TetR/AcrR family transcriptional regulator [Opitutaceae bacterium]|nr:TetR/AcrR family transcriptional regulator [Opitutaceae bacterium]